MSTQYVDGIRGPIVICKFEFSPQSRDSTDELNKKTIHTIRSNPCMTLTTIPRRFQ